MGGLSIPFFARLLNSGIVEFCYYLKIFQVPLEFYKALEKKQQAGNNLVSWYENMFTLAPR